MELGDRLSNIRLFVMDVDGVMTDGRIILGDGIELKSFNVQDGYGIKQLSEKGITPVIITKRRSTSVEMRSKELDIHELYQGVLDKKTCLNGIMAKYSVDWSNVCYMGDDIPDLDVMKLAGFSVAVSNAVDEIKQVAHYITRTSGGNGAIREVADLICKAKGS